MPTYEYACLKCNHEYEKREGFDAPATQKCPKCRGRARRVFHATPIVFKGSGFYVTDSRGASPTVDSPSKVEPKADSPKKADDTSDKTVEAAAAG